MSCDEPLIQHFNVLEPWTVVDASMRRMATKEWQPSRNRLWLDTPPTVTFEIEIKRSRHSSALPSRLNMMTNTKIWRYYFSTNERKKKKTQVRFGFSDGRSTNGQRAKPRRYEGITKRSGFYNVHNAQRALKHHFSAPCRQQESNELVQFHHHCTVLVLPTTILDSV